MIEFKSVDFEFDDGRSILKDFSFSIKKHSFVALLGHNGSGKSTIARLINGLYTPTKGQILVDGIDTSDEKTIINVRRKVGVVFQNPDNQLVSTIVEDDVAFGPENLLIPRDEMKFRVESALKAVDMYDYRREATYSLSGGQKQRIAIAGILAMQPDYIILDEPTAMLDPVGRRDVMQTLKKLNDNGITIVLITHHMEEAQLADRAVVINDGVILADDMPDKVFDNAEVLKEAGLELPKKLQLKNRLLEYNINLEDYL